MINNKIINPFEPLIEEEYQKAEEAEEPKLKNFLEQITKENIAYNVNLRNQAISSEEAIIALECVVTNVNGYTTQTSHTKEPLIIGGSNPTFQGGHQSRLEIGVESNYPVETIKFEGWPPLEIGDMIKAYVLAAEDKSEKREIFYKSQDQFKSYLVKRELKKQEKAIKIEKLRDGKVVAVYHN